MPPRRAIRDRSKLNSSIIHSGKLRLLCSSLEGIKSEQLRRVLDDFLSQGFVFAPSVQLVATEATLRRNTEHAIHQSDNIIWHHVQLLAFAVELLGQKHNNVDDVLQLRTDRARKNSLLAATRFCYYFRKRATFALAGWEKLNSKGFELQVKLPHGVIRVQTPFVFH